MTPDLSTCKSCPRLTTANGADHDIRNAILTIAGTRKQSAKAFRLIADGFRLLIEANKAVGEQLERMDNAIKAAREADNGGGL